MSRALFVFGPSEPAYLPFLWALGAQGFRLHLLPATLVEAVRAAGLEAEDALAVLDASPQARAAGARLAVVLDALEPGLRECFALRDRSLWERMRVAFRATLVETAEHAAVVTAVLEELAARGDLAGVVLGYDMLPAGRVAAAVARRLGVPSVHVPHAVFPRARVPMPWHGAGLFADLVCAPGEFSRAGYLAAGVDPEAVIVTGCPRWDEYAGCDETRRHAYRVAVAQALRLDPAAPIVLFGPSWIERSTANASRHVPAALAVYQGVLAAAHTHAAAGVQLVVKLHPGEFTRPGVRPETLVEGHVGVARRAGVTRIAVTAGHRVELVAAADVVVTVNSNLGLEALMCGRPLVNVPLIREEADSLFAADTGVLALKDPAETEAAVSIVLADAGLRARLAADGRAALRHYVHAPDGHASERVAAVVTAIARPARGAERRQVVRSGAPRETVAAETQRAGAGTGLAPVEAEGRGGVSP